MKYFYEGREWFSKYHFDGFTFYKRVYHINRRKLDPNDPVQVHVPNSVPNTEVLLVYPSMLT